MGREVWIERRKWPDSPHYGMTGTVLGEDDYGVWVGAQSGSRIVLPDGSERTGERRALWCVPRDDWFLLHVWDGHPEVDIYVDICTVPIWTERGVRMIDLDFDVIVRNEAKGGHVELVDEDEFDEHRVTLAYPPDLVANARRAAGDVLARVQCGAPPFTLASASRWLDQIATTV